MNENIGYIYLEDLDSTVKGFNREGKFKDIPGELILIRDLSVKKFYNIIHSMPMTLIEKILQEENEEFSTFYLGTFAWCEKESTKERILIYLEKVLESKLEFDPEINEILTNLFKLVQGSVKNNLSIIFDFSFCGYDD